MFLVKYNSAGYWQWTRQLGTANHDCGYAVAVDAGGNVYVTGYTGGGLDGNNNAGYDDMFLVKYNAAGEKQWTRQLGTTSSDYGHGVAVDASGYVYVAGGTRGGSLGGADAFLVNYDDAGTEQWRRTLGTAYDEEGVGIAVDMGGNAYVTGYTTGSLHGNTSAGGADMFLVKYNAAGDKQWTKQLGTTSSDGGLDVAVDAKGDVYVTGDTWGGLDGNTNAGDSDMVLVKYNADGVKQ